MSKLTEILKYETGLDAIPNTINLFRRKVRLSYGTDFLDSFLRFYMFIEQTKILAGMDARIPYKEEPFLAAMQSIAILGLYELGKYITHRFSRYAGDRFDGLVAKLYSNKIGIHSDIHQS